MVIYFLRHGDAVANAQVHDGERPLSDLGRRQATAVGHFLYATKTVIEVILCSPLARAQQTAEAVQRELGSMPIRSTDSLISSSNPRDILFELQKLHTERVLLVGHEPHLSKTISLFLFGDARSKIEMRPCSLACVTTPPPLEEGRGFLQWLLPLDITVKT